jgi:hypothetical protein
MVQIEGVCRAYEIVLSFAGEDRDYVVAGAVTPERPVLRRLREEQRDCLTIKVSRHALHEINHAFSSRSICR